MLDNALPEMVYEENTYTLRSNNDPKYRADTHYQKCPQRAHGRLESGMRDDIWDAIDADAESFSKVTTEGGSSLSVLCRDWLESVREVERLEGEIKKAKDRRDGFSHDKVPFALAEMGLKQVVVGSNKITLSSYVGGTMPKDPVLKRLALEHLRDIGCGDVIKTVVTNSFGLGQDNEAGAFIADCESRGASPQVSTTVAPSTLKRTLREKLEDPGREPLNLELFNGTVGTLARMTGE